MSYLKSDQEEADTKIVLHALDATASGATETRIHSPDTHVFILCLRRYPDLCQNTVFVTGKGQNYREINLQPIIRALGPLTTQHYRHSMQHRLILEQGEIYVLECFRRSK